VEVWQTSNLRPLRLGEEKKERRKIDRKIEITGQKYNGPLLHRAAIKNGDDQKKRYGREVRGVSPEAGRESMVGKICERGRS